MLKNKNVDIVCDKNLMLKTIAMPAHKNVNGNIFGGWIMSQMDIGGGILAKEISKGKVSTVYVKYINFLKPISAGDIVNCYARCIKIGNTSITIEIEVWVKKINSCSFSLLYCTNTATFVYVAIDKYGKPRILPITNGI
ncbi:Acyl-CoA thioester hydrolase YciA [Buchnera aphidicola (Cinara piceae)]|uniref:Acyl-CoA thioester hydrolase YciA n=1 Tax=Buchnera aphidicola (Cinara piceae) TaxID=1660043 RepID=A0A803FTU5_9GAMM|nr:acyl-CoA thioester hydrolase YciA [Buchnera aphidicola]VFP88259.1 Acyl-CoA thioester hydrolase YciA [Buchnera aphidicola (Cinara piceae)]